MLVPRFNAKSGGQPLFATSDCLVKHLQLPFTSKGHLFHPQPEDASCCWDRDSHISKTICPHSS